MNKPVPTLAALPAWRREEARRYRRLCQLVHSRMRKGESRDRAVHHFVRLYRDGRPFRCDPSRVFKFSRNTLLRKYAAWLQNPSAESVVNGHFGPRPATPRVASIRRALLSRCLESGVESIADVLRRFEADWHSGKIPGSTAGSSIPCSRRNLRRILADGLGPAGLRDLRRHFAQERQGRRQFRRVQAIIANEIASIPAPNPPPREARSEGRKIKK